MDRPQSASTVVKIEALEALHYAAVFGPLERARFLAMTGLPRRTARRVLASLLHFGVLKAETSRAAVEFAVPLKSLRFLFVGRTEAEYCCPTGGRPSPGGPSSAQRVARRASA